MTVVIDGFPELVTNKISKPRVFEKMINFISEIDDSDSIKLILSMRSTMWSRFYERIKSVAFLKKKWFSGSYFNLRENSNIPSLATDEIEEIFKKISPLSEVPISENLKSQLKFPFHIQWYYQLKEKYPDFNAYTNIIFFEIIYLFIQDKIYQSNYATEKIVYCKKIIQLTNFGRNNSIVLKSDLIKDLSVFKNAYMELISDGILMEEKQSKNGFDLEFVRFVQPHVFEYFLFVELLDVYNHKMDINFYENLNNDYFGNQVRFQLLQWAIRFTIRLNKIESIKPILKLKLNSYEKNYLIYFIAENLNYIVKKNEIIKDEIKKNKVHELLLKYLIHFDWIDSSYKETINSLLLIADDDDCASLYHAILSIMDCLSLDQDAILERIKKLENIEYDREKWFIDPSLALKIIYLKTKGIIIHEDETLIKIEQFKINANILDHGDRELPNINEVLSLLLMLLINLFYGSPTEAIKIINSILKLYPKIFISRKPFAIYLLNILAQAKAKTTPDAKTDQMERILSNIFEQSPKHVRTLYAQSLFLSLKAQQLKNKKGYKEALNIAQECLTIYERNNLSINQINTYNLIISIYKEMGDLEKTNDYISLKMNFLAHKNIHPTPFHVA